MMTADPFVSDPMNGQAWNRHFYVINKPARLHGRLWLLLPRNVHVGQGHQHILQANLGCCSIGNLLKIGSVFLCFGNPVCMAVTTFETTAFVAGVTCREPSSPAAAPASFSVTASSFASGA